MQKINQNMKLFIQEESNLLQVSTIRSVQELNQKFKQINDIYSFHNLIQQISSHISRMIFEKDKFPKFMRRLIEAICFALEKYAYDFTRTSFLVQTLNMVKKHWKIVLAQQFYEIPQNNHLKNNKNTKNNKNQNSSQIPQNSKRFQYFLAENQYMTYVLKCSNVLIEKEIFRLINNNSINLKSLFYIKKCFLKNIWTKIYDEMIAVAKETENQTYLKIELMIEFMKHILFQVNFCTTLTDFDIVYQRLFELAGYTFRLIKKFYSVEVFPFIQRVKKILLKGIMLFREISFEFPNKFHYLTNLIRLFDSKKLIQKRKGVTIAIGGDLQQFTKQKIHQPALNSKSYAIKLALRVMASWKKVKAKKDKEMRQKEMSSSIQNRSWSNLRKTEHELRQREKFMSNLEKEHQDLKKKCQRSMSSQNFRPNTGPILHNIQIRKQIEEQIDKEFSKLKYLKKPNQSLQKSQKRPQTSQPKPNSMAKERRRSISLKQVLGIQPRQTTKRKQNLEEKEINVEDYKQKLNLCRKQVNTLNRVLLYHHDKHSLVPHGGQKTVGRNSTGTGVSFMTKASLQLPGKANNNNKQKLRL